MANWSSLNRQELVEDRPAASDRDCQWCAARRFSAVPWAGDQAWQFKGQWQACDWSALRAERFVVLVQLPEPEAEAQKEFPSAPEAIYTVYNRTIFPARELKWSLEPYACSWIASYLGSSWRPATASWMHHSDQRCGGQAFDFGFSWWGGREGQGVKEKSWSCGGGFGGGKEEEARLLGRGSCDASRRSTWNRRPISGGSREAGRNGPRENQPGSNGKT